MKEQFSTPHNPSEAFAQTSQQEHAGYESVLDSEAAAYAAKPWMDVAVDLHEAHNAAQAWNLDDGETAYQYSENAKNSVDDLAAYAEARAHMAVEGIRDDMLTEQEAAVLDVYQAETEMMKAEAAVDIAGLTEAQVEQARAIAYQRQKEARIRGDAAEVQKWRRLKEQADAYSELIFGGLDADDFEELDSKVRPNTKNAGSALFSMQHNGGNVEHEYAREFTAAKRDAVNMRQTTALYELLAEVQAESGAEKSQQTPQEVFDIADSPAEAEELLYSQPELLEALFHESSAYNDYIIAHRDEFPAASKQFDIGLRAFGKDYDGFKTALDSWKNDSLGFASFDAYTQAIKDGDVEVDDSLWEAVSDARSLMKNKSWTDRLSQTRRRMVRRNTDKTDLTSVGTKFTNEYFKKGS